MNILIADDENVSRKKLQKIMETIGECEAVKNGHDALEAFSAAIRKGKPFDLISLDIVMPDMDGITALTKIREADRRHIRPDKKPLKILMVTSHSKKEAVLTCIKAGADGYIVKPFNLEVIVAKLKEVGVSIPVPMEG